MKWPLLTRKKAHNLVYDAQDRILEEHLILNSDISTLLKLDDAFNTVHKLLDL